MEKVVRGVVMLALAQQMKTRKLIKMLHQANQRPKNGTWPGS